MNEFGSSNIRYLNVSKLYDYNSFRAKKCEISKYSNSIDILVDSGKKLEQ